MSAGSGRAAGIIGNTGSGAAVTLAP